MIESEMLLGEVDGRCLRNTSRPETLCSKAFSSKTGGWEVKITCLSLEKVDS